MIEKRDDDFQQLISQMLKVRNAVIIDRTRMHRYGSFSEFMINLQSRLNSQYEQTSDDIKFFSLSEDQVKRNVLIYCGPPGSGKSRWRRTGDRFLQLSLEDVYFDTLKTINAISWEKEGEDAARAANLIFTPSYKPFTEQELKASNHKLTEATLTSVQNSWITTIEVPATTAVNVDGLWIGRRIGSELLHQLQNRDYPFNQLDYNLHVVGFFGGPLLRLIRVYGREAVRYANSLEEAKKVAPLYGIDTPKNYIEWEKLKEGASVEQIEKIEQEIIRAYSFLDRRKLISPIPFPLFKRAAGEIEVILKKGELLDIYKSWKHIAPIMEYIFDNFNMTPLENLFIGYNNPSLKELGIKPDNLTNLAYDLQVRSKRKFTVINSL